MSTEKKSVFEVLSSINVNDKVEKKNGLTYLSWAWAWSEVKKRYPDANYYVHEYFNKDLDALAPYLFDPKLGYMVKTVVTIGGDSIPMQLFVMDGANKPKKDQPYTYKKPSWQNDKKVYVDATVEAADMFDINTTIMRCLTKNLAMHGLGHYIYAGEDVPEQQVEDKPAPTASDKAPQATKTTQATTTPKKTETKPVAAKTQPKKAEPTKLINDSGELAPNNSFDDSKPAVDKTNSLSERQQKAVKFFSQYNEPDVIKFLIKEKKMMFASIKDFVEKTPIEEALAIASEWKELQDKK